MRHLRLVHSAPASRPTSVGQDAAAQAWSCAEGGCADVAREVDAVEPEVRLLLEHVRTLTPLPNVVRARALVRARAALAAPASTSTMVARAPSRRPSWVMLVVAIALAWTVGTAAGALLARRSYPTGSPPQASVSSPVASFETVLPRE